MCTKIRSYFFEIISTSKDLNKFGKEILCPSGSKILSINLSCLKDLHTSIDEIEPFNFQIEIILVKYVSLKPLNKVFLGTDYNFHTLKYF